MNKRPDFIKLLDEKFGGELEYSAKEKLAKSEYFVGCVENEIGKIAFDNDYELTKKDQQEIINQWFKD